MNKSHPILTLSALAQASRRFDRAQQACPHWDYGNDADLQDCCIELSAAEHAFKVLNRRAAAEKPR